MVREELAGGQEDVRDGGTAHHHPVPQPAVHRVLRPGRANPEVENYLKLLTMRFRDEGSSFQVNQVKQFLYVLEAKPFDTFPQLIEKL